MSALSTTLDNLITRAIAHPGQSCGVTLSRGLDVRVVVIPSLQIVTLSLSRPDDEYPANEWNTVMKFWPWPAANSPDYVIRNGRKTLTADISMPLG